MSTGTKTTAVDPWKLWTAAEVAAALSVARSTVYAWAEIGLLPCVRIGGTLRFDPSAVRAEIEGKQHGGPMGGSVVTLRRRTADGE